MEGAFDEVDEMEERDEEEVESFFDAIECLNRGDREGLLDTLTMFDIIEWR